jgi:GntR family transcriptional repressor for pyruvate dehydrogenase complex
MYGEVQYGRLYEQIVDRIENRILEGELEPGDKLPPEHELAKQFGVSRTAIREAMKALSQKGLIVVQPGRGTFVIDSTSSAMRNSIDLFVKIGSIDGIVDLVEVREIMEPEIAAMAANRATQDQIADMLEAVEAMDKAMNNPEAFVEADLDFHLALAKATHNTLIPILIDALVDLLREHRKRAASVKGGMERSQPYHKSILDAVKAGDASAARETMRGHLAQTREEVESTLAVD